VCERAQLVIPLATRTGAQFFDEHGADAVMPCRPVDGERSYFRHLWAERCELAAAADLASACGHDEAGRVDGELLDRAWQEMPFDEVRRDQRVDVTRVMSFGRPEYRASRSGHSVCPLLSDVGQR